MPKLLGIDYGENKVGIAVSDEDKKYAFSRQSLINLSEPELLQNLSLLCKKEDVAKIIIGLPLDQEGNIGRQAAKTKRFGEVLADFCKIPVEYEDERFSTAMAEQMFKQAGKKTKNTKSIIDQQAAQIILQTYLDKHNA